MRAQPLAREIMSRQVVGIRADATVAQAIDLMLDRRLSALPVTDGEGGLVGIVSEGDLLRRSELGTERERPRWLQYLLSPGRLSAEYARAYGKRVDEVMTREVVTVGEEASAAEIVALMERHRIKRLPVTSAGRMVGIVARADLMRALADAMRAPAPPATPRSDADIRRDILAEFVRVPCIPAAQIAVAVRDGVVDLAGALTDERERGAVHVAVEGVPGVTGLHDHMILIEPLSGEIIFVPDEAPRPADGPAP
ncbi:CBS domain-containing protein [Methylobacterium currus]|uniref:CBS domain-containing protein n=1 Tax=Methylobacterium currus TaxID=2051553 RepID=A0A2R4WNC7_9HYPH|nr:CBS domain-containing protein [Methylobacterium currus]AWB23043.1 CBS domain-containing protein [Methylobacterium currus]UHC17069.1 CBS domain-containing protein [Methylobacterium currus]